MKRRLLLITFVVMSLSGMKGQTFSVASLNVDGLPQKVLGISVNGDGPGVPGTLQVSRYLEQKGYDIIGVQEDFEYDHELRTSLSADYDCGEWQGSILDNIGWTSFWDLKVYTDGLRLFWRKEHTMADYYDELSGDDWPDKEARWSQWRQLRDTVMAHLDDRPVVLVGDMNSYYTRDSILSLFIQPIENTGRYTVHDAWVEYVWQGRYPTIGDAPLDPEQYDDLNGREVKSPRRGMFIIRHVDGRTEKVFL